MFSGDPLVGPPPVDFENGRRPAWWNAVKKQVGAGLAPELAKLVAAAETAYEGHLGTAGKTFAEELGDAIVAALKQELGETND